MEKKPEKILISYKSSRLKRSSLSKLSQKISPSLHDSFSLDLTFLGIEDYKKQKGIDVDLYVR